METIKFENKEYSWEDIPGKGKCLVPVQQKVSMNDVLNCRRFLSCGGEILRFILVYDKKGSSFYAILNEDTGTTLDIVADSATQLAQKVSKVTNNQSNTAFASWI